MHAAKMRVPKSTRRPSRGLIALNLALLAGLAAVSLTTSVSAQGFRSGNDRATSSADRVRGEYAVVAGETLGGVSSVIYVLDSANRELIAIKWDDGAKALEGIGYRDMNVDTMGDPDR